ncbi:MAG TPA: hypothetical protein VKA94_06280, partial [Hyphomicrobiales bacterium]|nr:hypothetical protein [Hyphomicrobiales bacterium]
VYFKRADLGNSDVEDADFAGAIIWHSDLSKVRNLTVQQLENVLIDQETKLPDYLAADFKPKQCWDKMQRPPFPYAQPWWTYTDPVINRAICGRKPVPLPDTADCKLN